ncbi:translation initiation factor 2 [Methylobacterium sp. 13MFTsu3.1M2]|uniref:translation initiation factor 2 n=1 Tax=Methylobacterium sp. 13MFTsu3.1M2 TaxID=1502776 RepID=UPI001FCDE7FD|nr:translation initiation factor 2 [Methylobacterium sp. 13MFTsu3.1M2]
MTAKPGTTDPKADAGKLASGADSLKPSTGPAAQSAGAKPDPVTAGAASSASDGRTGASPSSSSTASTAASGTSGAKIDPKAAQPGTGPQGGPRPGGPAPGAAGPAAASAVTAGPIIDLKAKRIPDPATAGKEPGKDASRDTAQNTFKDTPKDASRDGKEPPKGPIPAVAAVDPSRSAAAPAGRARAGFGSLAAAGLLGGVIGAGLLFGAEKAGIGPDPRLSALDQRLSSQLASLDKRLDGQAPRDAVTALDKRVAAAEASAKQALDKSGAAPASTADGQAAGQASGQAPAVPPDLVARLDSLDQRVAALQEEPGQEPGRDQPADSKLGVVQDNAKQIADLETRLKAVEDGGANKGAAEEAARKVAALQSEVEQKTKANAEADAALGQRLDALQQAVDARVKAATEAVQAATQASRTAAEAGQAQAAEAAKAVDRRLQEQADQIAALDKSVAQRAEASTVQAALRVVVADRVAAALESGTSYAEPLATLRKLDPGTDAQAKALAPFADGGAPSAGDLADTFRPIAERIAAKRQAQRAKSAAETGDFRTKLLSMADGLVQIRKADAPAPEAADDPESKVQAALDRGDLPAASAAFAALPAEAREQAGDFGAKLKARAEAEQAVRALLDGAFKALPVGAAQPAQAAPGR